MVSEFYEKSENIAHRFAKQGYHKSVSRLIQKLSKDEEGLQGLQELFSSTDSEGNTPIMASIENCDTMMAFLAFLVDQKSVH